jgi:hypothetical protein
MNCQVGYTLVNGNCISCNSNNCLFCSAPNQCAACLGNFANVGGSCQVCLNPCKTCTLIGTCATCMFPYSLNPNSNGQCYSCSDPNCKNCNFPEVSFCKTCVDGYTASNGVCVDLCVQDTCITCSSNNATQCTLCLPGYYITLADAQCMQCPNAPKCLSCVS